MRRRFFGLGLLLLLGLAGSLVLSTEGLVAFGGLPNVATIHSTHFRAGQFHNEHPVEMMKAGHLWEGTHDWLFKEPLVEPSCPLPLVNAADELATPPDGGLRITWLGHSTTLIEVDGVRVLTDPQWSERASPSTWVGPVRFHPPPLPMASLPKLDAVLISHDHYDHLDMNSVRTLAITGVVFHVGLGVGAHLRKWKVPDAQIVEHDWWSQVSLGPIKLVSTPSQHFSGRRGVTGADSTLWTSWALVGPKHRVYFSGDTGLSDAFGTIGEKLGPFDVAMLEIGQWHPSWGDIHLGPAGALEAHRRIGAKYLFPIHWATFELGTHSWSGPAEQLFTTAGEAKLLTPQLGAPVVPGVTETGPWWRVLPPTAQRCP